MDFISIGLGKLITPEVSTIITLVAVVFLIRRQEEKIDSLTKALKEREAKFDDKIANIENQMKDFITKEEHYRDVSGWRGELQKLENKLDRFIERFLDTRRD
jgi:predicted  nucleic acid-binding Zn-ribbon protein